MLPVFGIHNYRNTCYINSVIQCLRHNIELLNYLLSPELEKHVKNDTDKLILVESFSNIIKSTINNKQKTIIKPVSFIQKFDKKFSQVALNPQDAHEALVYLLDQFHESTSRKVNIIRKQDSNLTKKSVETWKKFYEKGYSEIIDIFFGQMETRIKCSKCNNITNSFEPFNHISLDITPSIVLSLKKYFAAEKIEKKCEKCSKEENVEMLKACMLNILPDHLIIQVKRFRYTNRGLAKLNNKVEIPEFIDLTEHYGYYGVYSLYGGIVHMGSPTYGHYISFCKTNNFWMKYDDSSSSHMNPRELDNYKSQAYILFYRKN